MKKPIRRSFRWPTRHNSYLLLLLIVTSLISMGFMLMPFTTRSAKLPLQVGDVTSQDILAPRAITYQSEVLTEEERGIAASTVEPIYSPPDASVARAQIEGLRAAQTFITSVRMDEFASQEQKLTDLAALQDIQLSQEQAEAILELSDSAWQTVRQETILVLEQVMRSEIRDDRLEDARRSVPALVSLSIPEDQANLVTTIASAFIAPNSLFSETLTEDAKDLARASVEPVVRNYVADETVVGRGQVITPEILEALEKLGLVQSETKWQDIVGVVSLVIVSFSLITLYLNFRKDLLTDLRGLALIAILFLVFLFGGRLLVPERTVIPYLYPVATFSLVVTALLSIQAAVVFTLPLTLLIAYGMPNALDLSIYYLFSSLFGALILKRAERIPTFFWAGAGVGLAGAVVVIAFRLPNPATDLIGILTLLGAAGVNGLAAASLTIILHFFLAQMLGLTTSLQLMEISRSDHPLLQFVLRHAPGTYQHSLQIANLAEQAADLIGAQALLTRVGALYHDAGKARYPQFFIENQAPGSPNPHDELSPLESSRVIIRHVPDGLELARKHRLPSRILDFIAEHHGTLYTRYQYAKALEQVGGDKEQVDIEDFRYPGPRPQSVETALVMLADGCEARTRAERPKSKEELSELVTDVIKTRRDAGQLDDTKLTMQDLKVVAESFTTALRGMYHPRIEYPKIVEQPEPSVAQADAPSQQT